MRLGKNSLSDLALLLMLSSMENDPQGAPPAATNADREEAIFNQAKSLPAAQRAGYLQTACGGDQALLKRIQRLLESSERAGDFLEPAAPAAGPSGTIVVTVPPSEKPGDFIGHYKIREQIGEGGCGIVYVAEQTEPVRRRVALKVIKLGMDTRSVMARFEAERQALAMMDHPNIARVLDAGATETGRPYFVMELVRGIKITEYCDQHNLHTDERLDLFIQVCHAVQHAHQKGVIHRDIKPSNILVTLHDGVPVPKVIDFGIAKATEGRLTDLTVYTELHQFIGTPAYMSPEQAEMSGLDIDTRSDIYSLGVLLYELLTGRTPFDAKELLQEGLDQMRKTIREREPIRPSTRLSTLLEADLTALAKRHGADAPKLIHLIRGDLDWIVMKALEKDRTRRYETSNALAADAQRFLKNEPVEARPPSGAYRFQKMVRRNKTAFAAVSAVAGALVFGLGLSLYLYSKERQALRLEKQALQRAIAAERQEALLRDQAEKGLAIERRMREMAPVADKLSTAGFLLSQGLFDKAEDVMKDVPPMIPQSASIFNVLGEQHVRLGEWPLAITNFTKAVQFDPTNHLWYQHLAPLLVMTGDHEGYQRLCDQMLREFGSTSDPPTADRMAKACMILPPPAANLQTLARMADTAVGVGPSDSNYVFYELVKALAEYRLGNFAAASDWAQKVVTHGGELPRTVEAYAVLAMAQSRLRQGDQANATLTMGRQLVQEKLENYRGVNWHDRIGAQILMNEAAALIESDASAAQGQK
jgi:serine/threonine protein kinase